MASSANPGKPMKNPPKHKVTPASGIYLVNPERRGVLVLDQQNVAGQFAAQGFRTLDPRWYLNVAHLVTNLERAVMVADLQTFNPLTNQRYLDTSWIWDKYGYWITHVPARRIQINQSDEGIRGDQSFSEEEDKRVYERKDMTDSAVRDSIQIWSSLPDVTHILLASHDSDFARDIKRASWAKGKKVTLLTVGKANIAMTLRNAVDEVINVMDYAPSYSVYALNKRGWWRQSEDLEARRQKIQQWFNGDGVYPRYLERQLSDMQLLFHHMIDKLNLLPVGSEPDAQKLSLGRLKHALHQFMCWEKAVTRSKTPYTPNPAAESHSIEKQDLTMLPAQARACNDSLAAMIHTLVENRVILFSRDEKYGSTKLYQLNPDHPAIPATLGLSFT
jgi:NYN domain